MTYSDQIASYSATYPLESSNSVESFMIEVLGKVLETSGSHDHLLTKMMKVPVKASSDIWVLTQYQIEFYMMANKEDKIQIDTQILDANRAFITRYFRVMQNNSLVMEVYIQFVAINFQDRKIVRLNLQGLEDLNLLNTSKTFKFDRIKLPAKIKDQLAFPVIIQAKDIDMNNHVNNLVYLKWCFKLMADLSIHQKLPMTLSVKYGQELLVKHQVFVYPLLHKEKDQEVAYFLIYNRSKEEEASSIKIRMKENQVYDKFKITT